MLENYSPQVQKALKKFKIGERIQIKKGKRVYEGLLMPRIELGDRNSVVIKLDNGYNIGIKYGKEIKIKKSEHREPKEVREEEEFELGRLKERFKLEHDPKKPTITLITTGGTISSKVEYKTGGVTAIEKPEEILINVPEIQKIANLKILTPFRKMSEDMEYTDWQELAKLTAQELNKGNAVIIAHGTDTLHYTAYALSFMLRNLHKPVVFVGAQRSPDRGSSDAFMNLICAAHAALSDIGEVGTVMHGSMNDDYCDFNRATRVRKMHSTRRDTFQTLNDSPLARIYPDGRIEKVSDYRPRDNSKKVVADIRFNPKVALVKSYPHSEPDVLNYYVKKGYRGFVIEGTGMGHVPTFAKKSWIPFIKKLSKKYPVVVTTQTLYGRVNKNVYTNLRILYYEAGAIPGEDMIPETALIKLGWVLANYKSRDKIREAIITNLAGEISERSSA